MAESTKTQTRKTPRQYLSLVLKIAFVFGLLYFLAKKGFISVQATERALSQTGDIIPAFLALIVATILGVIRWQWLLEAQDIHLKWTRTLQLTFIGNFFNIALPGAVSGDFVKAFYVGKEIGGLRARAFGSILFDRVAGLSALVLLSAVSFTLGIQGFWNTPLRGGVQAALIFAAAGVVVFLAYLFLVREHHDPLLLLLRRIETRWPKLSAVARIYEGLRHYHNHRFTVLKALAISVAIHMLVGWSCLHFALALGEGELPLLSIYVVVPLGLLVTAVPIMPAGVGTGHASFAYLFNLIGSQRGADTFSLYAISNIILSGIGGLVYLRFKSHEPAAPLTPAVE